MRDPTGATLFFLAVSSLQLAAVGVAAALVLRIARATGLSQRRVLALVVAVPALSLLAVLVPVEAPIAIPTTIAAPFHPVAEQAAPMAVVHAPAPAVVATGFGIDWRTTLLWLWLIGSGLGAARLVVGAMQLHGTLARTAEVSDPETLATYDRCCRDSGVGRRPRLLVEDGLRSPFAVGALRPAIVVPATLLAARDDLRFALLHELAHHRRRHCWWIAPELLLRTVYFFHPVLRRALSRLREEREHRCDSDVIAITGRRAAYATFLLTSIRGSAGVRREPWVFSLHRGSLAARRVRRILDGGSQVMRGRHLTFACFIAVLGLVLAVGHVPVAAQEVGTETDSINASPTKQAGVYHVMPVFARVDEVKSIKRGGPYGPAHTRTLVAGNEWTFDKATGKLAISVAIDNDAMMVIVRGVRVRPWAWRASEKLQAGSVKVLLGDRAGVRGVDFDVDAQTGVIRFLKDEFCDKRKDYYISYDFPADPKRPNVGRGGSIGNHRDRAAVRRFLGIAEKPAKSTLDTVGTGGVATDDPRVFFLVRPFASDGTRVAIVKRSETSKPRWLERGTHYTYDDHGGTITLLGDVRVDTKAEMLFVHGTPRVREVFQFRRKVEREAAHVILGDKKLVEGTGYRVDYERGVVTVLDPGIKKAGVKFYVTVGSMSFGNHDIAVVRRLLGP